MTVGRRQSFDVLRRCGVCATLAVLWSGLNGLVALLAVNKYADEHQSLYPYFLYDLDMLVLLFCVVFSFEDWRERLSLCGAARQRAVVKKAPVSTELQSVVSTV